MRCIETPILKRSWAFYGRTFTDDLLDWDLCADFFHKIFDFPRRVKQIQLVAYSTPGSNRVHVRIVKLVGISQIGDWDLEIPGMRHETLYTDYATMCTIRKLSKGRKNWYVELYYWD